MSHPDGEGKRVFVKVYDVAARIAAEAQDGSVASFHFNWLQVSLNFSEFVDG